MGGFGVMGEYELELVSQHPALPAQYPLLTQTKGRTRSNTLKHCFSPQTQTVAVKNLQKVEHIKEKGGKAPFKSMQRESVPDKRV